MGRITNKPILACRLQHADDVGRDRRPGPAAQHLRRDEPRGGIDHRGGRVRGARDRSPSGGSRLPARLDPGRGHGQTQRPLLRLLSLAPAKGWRLQPGKISANLTPFFAWDVHAFGQALVLIFWAYAGCELSTLPADEVRTPERTIPRSIVLGLIIVITFYLLTNFVVLASIGRPILTMSGSPLIDTAAAIFASPAFVAAVVAVVVGVGALLSITGADESGTIGTSRLAYAMSLDGLLPKVFSRTHNRFGTPYAGIVILCAAAYVASLLGGLAALINSSVFLLAVAYFATCLAALFLGRQPPTVATRIRGRLGIPVLGSVFCIVLILLGNPVKMAISIALLAVGIPVYTFFSPKQELQGLKAVFLSREAIRERARQQATRFLAFGLHVVRDVARRLRRPQGRDPFGLARR